MTSCADCKHNIAKPGKEVEVALRDYPLITQGSLLDDSSKFVKVTGAVGSGKTEYLVRKVARLLEHGMDAGKVCVVVATADAQSAFRARLAKVCAQAGEVSISTVADLCVNVLDTPTARQATNRVPRVLTQVEYNFILEDLKTLGQQPGRLRKMLNYFYFQWSQLAPEGDWLLPREEHGVRTQLDTHLRMRGGMLREELAPLSVSFLESDAGTLTRGLFDVVLVDDYQNLSKASQIVCRLLSAHSVIVTGNENQFVEGFDPHPFKEGFCCFEHYCEGALCVRLGDPLVQAPAITAFSNALCQHEGMMPERVGVSSERFSDNALTHITWHNPDDEFGGITRLVNNLFHADDTLEVQDVYLVAPNRAWARALEHRFSASGIRTQVVLDEEPLRGDPRDIQKAFPLMAYTKLNLVADPSDVVAWRSWCGFGNYLCYSGAWTRLEAWAQERKVSVVDALGLLEQCDEDPFLEASVLRERFLSGRAALEELSSKSGFALAKALVAEPGTAALSALIEPVQGDESAEVLYARARSRMLAPSFNDATQSIRIGSFKHLQGLAPRIVVVSGFVDGFMPSRLCFDKAELTHERTRELIAQRRIFYNAAGKAREKLVLSVFQKADLETAERCKVDVKRVRMDHGQRVALVSRSVFMEEAAEAAPGPVSGEQYLAR